MQSLRERQAYPSQKGSYNIYANDNPSFDEKAVRAIVDKSEHISWVIFTLNGKAYEMLIPSNITPEQREALINLLKQEPNGEAGPLRLVQLMNQVGIAAKVTEMTGRDLVAEFTGNESFIGKTPITATTPTLQHSKDVTDAQKATSKHVVTLKVTDSQPAINVVVKKNTAEATDLIQASPISATSPSTRFDDSSNQAQWEFKGVSEDGRDIFVDALTGRTIVMDDDGNIMPGPITEPGSQTAEPASGPSLSELLQQYAESKPEGQTPAAKEEVNQTMMEVQTGISSGWTPEAERIYTLVDTAQKQSIQNGNSVAQVDLGDKPNFDEKATRSFIDKLNTSGADLKFTADGKAYNINVPAGTTVEQREALINLLKQEPNGEAGPARLAQLMQQVGINIIFTERSGKDLVNEFTGNAIDNAIDKKPFMYGTAEKDGIIINPADPSVKVVIKEYTSPVQATKSVKASLTLRNAISVKSK
jgi:hypothetical protein